MFDNVHGIENYSCRVNTVFYVIEEKLFMFLLKP